MLISKEFNHLEDLLKFSKAVSLLLMFVGVFFFGYSFIKGMESVLYVSMFLMTLGGIYYVMTHHVHLVIHVKQLENKLLEDGDDKKEDTKKVEKG